MACAWSAKRLADLMSAYPELMHLTQPFVVQHGDVISLAQRSNKVFRIDEAPDAAPYIHPSERIHGQFALYGILGEVSGDVCSSLVHRVSHRAIRATPALFGSACIGAIVRDVSAVYAP